MSKDVLVVDDDQGLTQFLQEFFSQEGYQMLTALDGPSAIETVRRRKPALVLLDMKLPGLDGAGVLKRIRQEQPSTKVIAMTSYDEDYKRICEELGVDGFFAKPIGLTQLSARIAELLRSQPDPPALALPEADTLIPAARLLLVGPCAIMSVKVCISDRASLNPEADELDRAIGVARYETADAYRMEEVYRQLRQFRPDLVLIASDFVDDTVDPPMTAARVAAEVLHASIKPKEIIIFGGLDAPADTAALAGDTPVGVRTAEVPILQEWGSPDYLQKAARFSRLLRETCLRLGLVAPRPPDSQR